MSEPIYRVQTFEAANVSDDAKRQRWFREQGEIAADMGVTWPRMTISDAGDGLLYEGWLERPDDAGDPRWMLKPTSGGI